MTLLWPLIYFIAILFHSVHSDAIDSKSEDRDQNSRSQSSYDSNVYSSQSLHTTNGLNSPQQSLLVSESNSVPYYSPGHQTNDQIENKNDKKTLILAIPVKLSLPKTGSDNYDPHQAIAKSGDLSPGQLQSNFYAKTQSGHNPQSLPLEAEESDPSDQSIPKGASLPPLSQKIYSSLESQLKSSSYSPSNAQKFVSEQSVPSSLSYSNDQKYKNSYDLKDQKSIGSQYGRDANTYRGNEYKSANNEGFVGLANDYGLKYSSNKATEQLPNKYDSYDPRMNLKDSAKHVYESVGDDKSEYDYDNEEEEEMDDNKKVVDEYTVSHFKGFQINNNGYNSAKNLRKNVNNEKNYGNYGSNPTLIANLMNNGKAITGQTLPFFANDPMDGWPQYYYSKSNLNGLPRLPEPIDANLLSLLNGYKNPIKDNVRNGLYAPAFDLLADTQLKAASNQNPLKALENSKIYGPAVKYQSSYPMINLLAGYGRDFGLVDVNGELYPTPLSPSIVPQPTPRQQLKPLQQNESKGVHNSANRDSIKPHRRNPLLLRPSFMSGLRSSASKPLSAGSPFGSASTTHSLFSVLPSLPSLPSLPTSFHLNAKSIPRQIFPYFYG